MIIGFLTVIVLFMWLSTFTKGETYVSSQDRKEFEHNLSLNDYSPADRRWMAKKAADKAAALKITTIPVKELSWQDFCDDNSNV